MVKITADQPLQQFAEKIAERTGISRQNVTHVLAAAMVVANENDVKPKEPAVTARKHIVAKDAPR